METMESKFKLIYPGTLWCGGGTLARNNNDYGLFRKTDKCCRKHDSCPKYIAAGDTWKNLENVGIFTRYVWVITSVRSIYLKYKKNYW